MKASREKQSGLTLVELLVSMAILSLIGVGAWSTLDNLIISSQKQKLAASKLIELQKAIHLIDEDMQYWVDRPIRDESDILRSSISTEESWCSLCLSRLDWFEPEMGMPSAVQRIGYQLNRSATGNYSLIRLSWDGIDRTYQTGLTEQKLIDQVESLKWQFVTESGLRLERWPRINSDAEINGDELIAIQMSIELPDLGTVVRLYPLLPNWQIVDEA